MEGLFWLLLLHGGSVVSGWEHPWNSAQSCAQDTQSLVDLAASAWPAENLPIALLMWKLAPPRPPGRSGTLLQITRKFSWDLETLCVNPYHPTQTCILGFVSCIPRHCMPAPFGENQWAPLSTGQIISSPLRSELLPSLLLLGTFSVLGYHLDFLISYINSY